MLSTVKIINSNKGKELEFNELERGEYFTEDTNTLCLKIGNKSALIVGSGVIFMTTDGSKVTPVVVEIKIVG